MNRRRFLQASAGGSLFATACATRPKGDDRQLGAAFGGGAIDSLVELASFEDEGRRWTAYEDRSSHDGPIRFRADNGETLTLAKRLEATDASGDPPYFGLPLKEVALAEADLLADRLLANGDPDPEAVRDCVPPLASGETDWGNRLPWTTFVGTPQAGDVMPVYTTGRTRSYTPRHDFADFGDVEPQKGRREGLLGGWLPAVHRVLPRKAGGEFDILVFGDVDCDNAFYVHTWHRTQLWEGGRLVRETFGHSHARFPPRRVDPAPADFYRGLLRFARLWAGELDEGMKATLPDPSWADMARHAFAKELIVRPGGVYPRYGAVDRDYAGSEYDGFQDIFTSSLYANLEWGRFAQAQCVLDQYLSDLVEANGLPDMRGPEVAQFGLTLQLVARYLKLTGDKATLAKHAKKIRETARVLVELHDEALKLPTSAPGHGLIHGWNESDACLAPDPTLWWKPYFANSAFAVRGWRDIAEVWPAIDRSGVAEAANWRARADQLQARLIESVRASVRRDLRPAYVPPLPGVTKTFREALSTEPRSEQGWPHRVYAELLQPAVLPDDLANVVIDSLRGHGGTTLGIVANIGKPDEKGRDILGFISYGHARELLRLDRIEEYLLFLYAHRFHNHTPGSWTAGEVSGITGDTPYFCMPAQLTMPKLVRWMLVVDEGDDSLHLLKAIPRDWLLSGREIAVRGAPTVWGKVDLSLKGDAAAKTIRGVVSVSGKPREMRLRLRLPVGVRVAEVRVNGKAAAIDVRSDVVLGGAADGRYQIEVVCV